MPTVESAKEEATQAARADGKSRSPPPKLEPTSQGSQGGQPKQPPSSSQGLAVRVDRQEGVKADNPANKMADDEAAQGRAEGGGSDSGWREYTAEEWAQWKAEQQKKWEVQDERAQEQRAFNKEVNSKMNALNAAQKKIEWMFVAQNAEIMAIGELATKNDARSKKDDIELALRQIRLVGWAGEDERERRVAVKRWMDHYGFDHEKTATLHKAGSTAPLHFSLVTCHSRGERDKILAKMQQEPVMGLRGSRLQASKNIARFQREAGEWCRFLMALLEMVGPGTTFSDKHWEFDAVEVGGRWAGAILPSPHLTRAKVIAYNPELYKGEDLGRAAAQLWKTWAGKAEMWQDVKPDWASAASSAGSGPAQPHQKSPFEALLNPNSSTANSSTWHDVASSSAHTHHISHWWSYSVTPLTATMVEVLEAAKAEKYERDERRRTNRRNHQDADMQGAPANAGRGGMDHTLGPPAPKSKKGGPPQVVGADDTSPLDDGVGLGVLQQPPPYEPERGVNWEHAEAPWQKDSWKKPAFQGQQGWRYTDYRKRENEETERYGGYGDYHAYKGDEFKGRKGKGGGKGRGKGKGKNKGKFDKGGKGKS